MLGMRTYEAVRCMGVLEEEAKASRGGNCEGAMCLRDGVTGAYRDVTARKLPGRLDCRLRRQHEALLVLAMVLSPRSSKMS